jgi:hypothetical protein
MMPESNYLLPSEELAMQSNRALPSDRGAAIQALPSLRILMELFAIRASANCDFNRDRNHARIDFATSNK